MGAVTKQNHDLKFSYEIFLLVFHLRKKVLGDLHRSHSAAHPPPLSPVLNHSNTFGGVDTVFFFFSFSCTWHISVLNGRLLFLSMCWTMGELFLPFQYFRELCNGFF
jgi:hypothetical protein